MFANKTQHQGDQENDPSDQPILNDDCIQEIFRRVDLKTFLNIAQVCRQFLENARRCIRANHRKELIIADYVDDSFSILEARYSNLLEKFGHLVDTIVWIGDSGEDVENMSDSFDIDEYDVDVLLKEEDDGYIFEGIIQHCAENLKILDMVEVRTNNFSMHLESGSAFGSLEEIRLSGIPVYHEEEIGWFKTTFPKLEKVHLKNMGIEQRDLIEFLKHNPQIRSLEMFNCYHITTEEICQQFPHIKLKLVH